MRFRCCREDDFRGTSVMVLMVKLHILTKPSAQPRAENGCEIYAGLSATFDAVGRTASTDDVRSRAFGLARRVAPVFQR
jgi:hypothetical protein